MFNESALNGISHEISYGRDGFKYKIIDRKEIEIRPLGEVLTRYLPVGIEIDFLSVDIEGMDLNVLRSNDWHLFSPGVVIVEMIGSTLKEVEGNSIYKYLLGKGYKLFAKAVHSAIFIKCDFKIYNNSISVNKCAE